MQGLYYGIAAGVAALASILQVAIRKNKTVGEKARGVFAKIAAYALMAIFAVRFLCKTSALLDTFGLNIHSPFGVDGQGKTFLG